MGTYIGLTIYLPVYFEAVRGFSASHSGLALIPLMAGTVVGATLSGTLHGEVHPLQAAAVRRPPSRSSAWACSSLAGGPPVADRDRNRARPFSASASGPCCPSPRCRSRTRCGRTNSARPPAPPTSSAPSAARSSWRCSAPSSLASGDRGGRASRPLARRSAARRRSLGGLPVRVRGGIRGLRPFAPLPAAHEGTALARQRGPGRRRGDRRLNLPTDVETCNREVTAGPNLDPRARAAIASRSRARTLSIVVVRQSARALRGPWGALLRAADALIP